MTQKEGQSGLTAIEGGLSKTAGAPKKIIITDRRLARIKARMAELSMAQATLADLIGVTPSAVSVMLAGKTDRTQNFPSIARALKVDLDWLLGTRDGEYDEDQLQLGEGQAGGTRELVALVPEIDLLGRYQEMQNGIPITGRRNPIGKELMANYCETDPVHLMTMQGIGDVMVPTLFDSDLVFLDSSKRQMDRPDRIWLIRYAGMLMVRRLRPTTQGIRMSCDTQAMAPEDVSADDLEILGLVVGAVRKF